MDAIECGQWWWFDEDSWAVGNSCIKMRGTYIILKDHRGVYELEYVILGISMQWWKDA